MKGDLKRNRYWVVSLRGLLAVVLVVALIFGGVISPYLGYRRQVEAMEQLGGNLGVEPCWQARAIGDTRTGPIVSAVFPKNLDDAGLAQVGRLADVEDLEIIEETTLQTSPLAPTSDGFASLASLGKLRRLYLNGTWVSDDVIKHLAGREGLTDLILSQRDAGHQRSRLTAAGLAHLGSLCNLRRLELCGGGIKAGEAIEPIVKLDRLENLRFLAVSYTPDWLRRLVALKQLRELSFFCRHLDMSGLGSLRDLPNLRVLELYLVGNPTDADLAPLQRLTQVRKLVLHCEVIDDHLTRPLQPLTHLEFLVIDGNQGTLFTEAEFDALKAALPKTEVLINGSSSFDSGFR